MSNHQTLPNSRACFVSDLHLFCDRSDADRHMPVFHDAAARTGTFILGGDILDFKWSRHGAVERTIAAGRAWLDEFVGAFPACQFHYLLGNHDCHPQFVAELEQLSIVRSNFQWHAYYLRMEETIFLHGDVTDSLTSQQQLQANRGRWSHGASQSSLANNAYNAAVAIRLHRMAAELARRKTTVARRLLYYLHDIGQGPDSGIEQIYFGHTHSQMLDFHYEGIRFNNGGAPLKGLKFQLLEAHSADGLR